MNESFILSDIVKAIGNTHYLRSKQPDCGRNMSQKLNLVLEKLGSAQLHMLKNVRIWLQMELP